jgi:hypothetical protein
MRTPKPKHYREAAGPRWEQGRIARDIVVRPHVDDGWTVWSANQSDQFVCTD